VNAKLGFDVVHRPLLRPTDELLGCEVPEIEMVQSVGLSGTLMVNDKSKGVTWLLDLDTRTFKSVELPLAGGSHETAVSVDGQTIAVPQYEFATQKGQTEGGGSPGFGVSLIDIKTGQPQFLRSGANPFGTPKPHDAVWLEDGTLIVTAQEANGFVKHATDGNATAISVDPEACNTPHLIRLVPNSRLAVSGCRCTNAGCADSTGHPGGNGSMVVFDVDTGAWRGLPVGRMAEGITVTGDGDIWVGSADDDYVQVFSFGSRPRTLENLQYDVQLRDIHRPLRLEYDHAADKVAVASLDMSGDTATTCMLHLFNAQSRKLEKATVINTKRGMVNTEGLRSFDIGGRGYFIVAGFDTQTLVVLDSMTLEVVMSAYLPRCSTPKGLCVGTAMSKPEALANNETGANNWSGGLCPATLRSQWDRRWAVLDGVNFSPITGDWSLADPAP
jgi:hypothetical protein